jgi:hypothetical protein
MFDVMVISTRENAVPIATQFLNLPNYDELDAALMKEFNIEETPIEEAIEDVVPETTC